MPDCRNDCKEPLLFPKAIKNRPGLSRLGYRIGTYSDFREALLRSLDQDSALAPWTYRGSDDPGIALLEGAAIIGDILTFYQEVYANELYLPTATLPASIGGLVRLVGYRLSPGVGGRGVFAFEVSSDKSLVIPVGFPVTADVEGLSDPAEFETTAEITAVPALSKFSLYRPFMVAAISAGTTRFAVDAAQLADLVLEKGNRLMLVAGGYHQIAVIDKVEPRFEETEITIKGSWRGASTATLSAYKLGRDFRHFGHNAPPTHTVVTNDKATAEDVDFARRVADLTDDFRLDSQVDDLSAGMTLLLGLEVIPSPTSSRGVDPIFVFVGPTSDFVARQIVSVRQASLTLGSLTGVSTVVKLDQLVSATKDATTDVRTVQIHEVTGGPLTLKGVRIPIPGAPTSQLTFFGKGGDYKALDGRPLQFQRRKPAPAQAEAVEQVTAAISVPAIGDLAVVTLRPVTLQPALQQFFIDEFPLAFPPDAPPVVVYGNLATATQGKTEATAVLGNGDTRATFQTFPIPKAPVTYLVSKSATPPEVPELVITVDNLEWRFVPSLIVHGPKDQVYIVREDSSGQSYVQFGDGETGARLPSGVGNVACTYRSGIGAYGLLKPGASADAGVQLHGLESVALLDGATGGAASEDPEKARVSASGKTQSLGRLVSLRDFETETLGIPGVAVASAAWELVDHVPAVVLTVLMETGRAAEIATVTQLLSHYNVCRGPQRFAIVVKPGQRNYVYVDAAVALAPSHLEEIVFAKVRAAMAALFAAPKRAFGEREYRSRIEGVIQNVAGVLWNRVTALGSFGPADDPKTLTPPAPPRPVTDTIPCGTHELLALHAAHVALLAVAGPVSVCE